MLLSETRYLRTISYSFPHHFPVSTQPIPPNPLFLKLEYSWSTVLCQFLLHSKVTQSNMCIHSFSHTVFQSEIGYSSLCCAVGPHCLPILNVVNPICHFNSVWLLLIHFKCNGFSEGLDPFLLIALSQQSLKPAFLPPVSQDSLVSPIAFIMKVSLLSLM